jgi:hypothetical protein
VSKNGLNNRIYEKKTPNSKLIIKLVIFALFLKLKKYNLKKNSYTLEIIYNRIPNLVCVMSEA